VTLVAVRGTDGMILKITPLRLEQLRMLRDREIEFQGIDPQSITDACRRRDEAEEAWQKQELLKRIEQMEDMDSDDS